VATAAALLVFFWRTGSASSPVLHLHRASPDRHPVRGLAWLIVVATIPVGITGLLLEHLFRTTLGRPLPAAAFLFVNGLILLTGERLRRRQSTEAADGSRPGTDGEVLTMGAVARTSTVASDGVAEGPEHRRGLLLRLSGLGLVSATLIGSAQILALLPGISRSGATMVAGW